MDKIKVFFDLDGTVACWNAAKRFEELYEKGLFRNIAPDYDLLNQVNWLLRAKYILGQFENVDFYVLSAYLHDSKYALTEKREWVEEFLPLLPNENALFCPYGTDKDVFLEENGINVDKTCILVDDYTKNLLAWRESEGVGVKYLNGINHTNKTWDGDCIDKDDSMCLLDYLLNFLEGAKDYQMFQEFLKEQMDKYCPNGELVIDWGDTSISSSIMREMYEVFLMPNSSNEWWQDYVDKYPNPDGWNFYDFVVNIIPKIENFDDEMFRQEYEVLNTILRNVPEKFYDILRNVDFREELEKVGFGNIDMNINALIENTTYYSTLILATPEEQNKDMGSIVTAYGSWQIPECMNYQMNEEDLKCFDNALTHLIYSQGYTVKDVLNQRINPTASDNSFIGSLGVEILNNSSEAMSALAVLVKLKGFDICELVDTIADNDKNIFFSKESVMGLYNPWSGCGGPFDIKLEKPFVCPPMYIKNIEFNSETLNKIYGGFDENCYVPIEFTTKKAILNEEDFDKTTQTIFYNLARKAI